MPKRSSKKAPKDINQLAAEILAEAIGEPAPIGSTGKKNPAAVALGRLGGIKGGKARHAQHDDEPLEKGLPPPKKDKIKSRKTSLPATPRKRLPGSRARRATLGGGGSRSQ